MEFESLSDRSFSLHDHKSNLDASVGDPTIWWCKFDGSIPVPPDGGCAGTVHPGESLSIEWSAVSHNMAVQSGYLDAGLS